MKRAVVNGQMGGNNEEEEEDVMLVNWYEFTIYTINVHAPKSCFNVSVREVLDV